MTTYASPASSRHDDAPLPSWLLFAAVAILALVFAWYNNEEVLTRDLYRQLLADRLDASRIDQQWELTRRWSVFGYLIAPVFLLVRIATCACLVQMVVLLAGHQVDYGTSFRAAVFATGVLVLGVGFHAVDLSLRDGASLTAALITSEPLSLASLLGNDASPVVRHAFGNINLFEAGWLATIGLYLRRVGRVAPTVAWTAAASVWLVLTAVQWSLWFLLTGGATL